MKIVLRPSRVSMYDMKNVSFLSKFFLPIDVIQNPIQSVEITLFEFSLLFIEFPMSAYSLCKRDDKFCKVASKRLDKNNTNFYLQLLVYNNIGH